MTARIGAVHLGWDVVSVAGGGGGMPIRPVQVEGTYTPPAYLLADTSGRLHTAGSDKGRSDLGIAVSDVRDILGHRQIRIAGATWPTELVFRARLYNPLASIGKYVRGKPDVVALPYPDDWPDEKIDEYVRLVEQLDVVCEPLPESVALSGYVRAIGLVSPPEPGRRATGATGVYSDGRVCLVVSVNGDDEQPTESVGVPISADAMRDAHHADNVVIEVMAAARSIGSDTSTVLLSGNVCFNDALRLAFQNHLGHRLHVADHPMHALVLGAAHLLVTDSEYAEEGPDQGYGPEPARPGGPAPLPQGPGQAATPPRSPDQGRPVNQGGGQVSHTGPGGQGAQGSAQSSTRPNTQDFPVMSAPEGGGRHGWRGPERAEQAVARPGDQRPRHAAPDDDDEDATVRVARDQVSNVPPDFAAMDGRGTHLPSSPADTRETFKYGGEPAFDAQARSGQMWNKVKDNLFGAPTIVGAVALAAIAIHTGSAQANMIPSVQGAAAVVGALAAAAPVAMPGIEPVSNVSRTLPSCVAIPNAGARRGPGIEPTGDECTRTGTGNLRYTVPAVPAYFDPGPPIHV